MKNTALIAWMLVLTNLAYSEDKPNIPLEHFAKLPAFQNPMISPNGKRIAATMTLDGEPLVVVQKLMAPNDKKREPVEYIELPDGEHWRTNEKNEIKKFKAIEQFLAEHIGVGVRPE